MLDERRAVLILLYTDLDYAASRQRYFYPVAVLRIAVKRFLFDIGRLVKRIVCMDI